MHTFLEKCGKYEPAVPDIIYHYCTVDVMLKILQNYCIWLSDAEKTNDKTELRYFCNLMKKMFSDVFQEYQGKFDSVVLTTVKGVLEQAIESVYSGSAYVIKNTKNYISCFSESDDLLSQWRAYAGDGQGVAIGFNAKLLSEFNDMYQYDFIKIIYNSRKIKNNVKEYMVENLKSLLENISEEELNPIDIMLELLPIMVPILEERFAFKHPGFREEREWRLYRKQVENFDEDTRILN